MYLLRDIGLGMDGLPLNGDSVDSKTKSIRKVIRLRQLFSPKIPT